jgi:hypothetical protein
MCGLKMDFVRNASSEREKEEGAYAGCKATRGGLASYDNHGQ